MEEIHFDSSYELKRLSKKTLSKAVIFEGDSHL